MKDGTKNFYALFRNDMNADKTKQEYTVIQAKVLHDAKTYADHFWGTEIEVVLTSGQFWERKNRGKGKGKIYIEYKEKANA